MTSDSIKNIECGRCGSGECGQIFVDGAYLCPVCIVKELMQLRKSERLLQARLDSTFDLLRECK